MERVSMIALLSLIAFGCSKHEGPAAVRSISQDFNRQFPIRDRTAELYDVGPRELREMEARAIKEILSRQANEAAREGVRMLLDPAINGKVAYSSDSLDAELVSLVYSIRMVAEEKEYWEIPPVRFWWPIPEVRRLTPGGYDRGLDQRLQSMNARETYFALPDS